MKGAKGGEGWIGLILARPSSVRVVCVRGVTPLAAPPAELVSLITAPSLFSRVFSVHALFEFSNVRFFLFFVFQRAMDDVVPCVRKGRRTLVMVGDIDGNGHGTFLNRTATSRVTLLRSG